jgi:hypothetical protein
MLISRREALDSLAEDALAGCDEVFVLSDVAATEPEDEVAGRPCGFHAKLIGLEHDGRATWHVGSANLTRAAFTGLNKARVVLEHARAALLVSNLSDVCSRSEVEA